DGGRAGDRGPLPAPGPRAGPEEARGPPAPDPGDHARPRAARAGLRAGVSLGCRAAGRRSVRRPHQGLLVLGAVRGLEAQAGPLTTSATATAARRYRFASHAASRVA